jgi:tRNA1Val (adenine37-N6)-methyltransferase
MSNDYFQFKQFRIEQSSVAMKVGTDGVLLGSWVPLEGAEKALDVGTGTGLIALMMAQRKPILWVTAIDVDSSAAQQALQNVEKSPWKDKITVLHDSFQDFCSDTKEKFDVVVANPPFFDGSFHSPKLTRNIARHSDVLNFHDLLQGVQRILCKTGIFSLILPVAGFKEFEILANQAGLYEQKRLVVFPTPGKSASRILSAWSYVNSGSPDVQSMVLEPSGRHYYSDEYKDLTKEFYLKFR